MRVSEPHPTQVTGYERARALRLLPHVADTPPQTVGPDSRHLLLLTVAAAFGSIGLLIFVLRSFQPNIVVVGILCASAYLVATTFARRQRAAAKEEIAAGYCRMDTFTANLSRDTENRFGHGPRGGARWDLRGLWLLNHDGTAARPPVDGVLPAGHYPSPNRPGLLEMWTGEVWAYDYRDPAVPFM